MGIQQKSELQNFLKHFCIYRKLKENFEVGFVGAFFCSFFGHAKKEIDKKENISVEYVLYTIELTFFFLDEKEPKNAHLFMFVFNCVCECFAFQDKTMLPS